mmetsp:Transcript_59246/g.173293  ORF Transcript_59246/g.173293 Transcript_59246/m.173293 type:complete len:87 (+) Transcript_59246:32-292(+)
MTWQLGTCQCAHSDGGQSSQCTLNGFLEEALELWHVKAHILSMPKPSQLLPDLKSCLILQVKATLHWALQLRRVNHTGMLHAREPR